LGSRQTTIGLENQKYLIKIKTNDRKSYFFVKKPNLLEMLPFEAEEVVTALGEKIALARRARSWTQADLAAKMGVSVNTVVNLEKGRPSVAFGQVVMALWLLDSLDMLRAATRPEDDPVIQKEALSRLPKRARGTHG
jgi:DNA-binding XRE family transcriptional regulator